jgi:hypothetical protein
MAKAEVMSSATYSADVPFDSGTPRKSTPAPAFVKKPKPKTTGMPPADSSCVTPMLPAAAPGVPDFAL